MSSTRKSMSRSGPQPLYSDEQLRLFRIPQTNPNFECDEEDEEDLRRVPWTIDAVEWEETERNANAVFYKPSIHVLSEVEFERFMNLSTIKRQWRVGSMRDPYALIQARNIPMKVLVPGGRAERYLASSIELMCYERREIKVTWEGLTLEVKPKRKGARSTEGTPVVKKVKATTTSPSTSTASQAPANWEEEVKKLKEEMAEMKESERQNFQILSNHIKRQAEINKQQQSKNLTLQNRLHEKNSEVLHIKSALVRTKAEMDLLNLALQEASPEFFQAICKKIYPKTQGVPSTEIPQEVLSPADYAPPKPRYDTTVVEPSTARPPFVTKASSVAPSMMSPVIIGGIDVSQMSPAFQPRAGSEMARPRMSLAPNFKVPSRPIAPQAPATQITSESNAAQPEKVVPEEQGNQ